MDLDERRMHKALLLARLGRGRVEPNPVVGALVVQGGRVVGYGHHARYGGPHAEAVALEQAGGRARGAVLYVTLEPCAHEGKTPPCTDRILAAGISKVIYGAADPNPLTAGVGPARLAKAGVEVVTGVLGEAAQIAIEPYLAHLGSSRPYTIAKWAMTLDGKIADVDGGSKYITGPGARRLVHEIRGAVDAVVVGAATARMDDPDLTAREGAPVRRAVRIVVDPGLTLPLDGRLVRTAGGTPVWIATGPDPDPGRERALAAAGCRIVRGPAAAGRVDLAALFGRLKEDGIGRVLIEGGGELLASAFAAGVVDQVMAFLAPVMLGGRDAATPMGGEGLRRIADPLRLGEMRTERLGDDVLLEGFLPASA